MSTDVMIYADELTKRFGNFRALDRIRFEVRRGEVVGFLGPNGAGKSTTMRILTCFISPTEGTAKIHGHDVFDEPLEVRRKIGYLPQRAPLYQDMLVWDYLRFVAEMRGIDLPTFKSRMKKVVEVCGLAQVLGKDINTLSHGYRQRVGLGQALIHDPPILILDEPTSDLDPNEKAEVIRYIKEIGKERTILLSTHNLAEVETACARAIIVSKGRIVADGALDDIRSRSGRIRYVLSVNEQSAERGKAPTATEVQSALRAVAGVRGVTELPTDEKAHTFELAGDQDGDLRSDLFRLVVAKGWTLLELRRDALTLEDVFRDLTKGDERRDRKMGREADDEDQGDKNDVTKRDESHKEAAVSGG
jgi:gliding motility-associated transport system ATP-binding protein